MRYFFSASAWILFFFAGLAGARAATLELQAPEQDGFTNDHAYNNSDKVLLCGREGYVAVWEFPLKPGMPKPKKATLRVWISKVEKPGKVALYHMQNFNNGYAETQDFYSDAVLLAETSVEKPGALVLDVTRGVGKDMQGPGGFTSYYLKSLGAEVLLPSQESGKHKARIEMEPAA